MAQKLLRDKLGTSSRHLCTRQLCKGGLRQAGGRGGGDNRSMTEMWEVRVI